MFPRNICTSRSSRALNRGAFAYPGTIMGYGNSGTAIPTPIHDIPLGRPHPTHPLAPVR